jgi:hypothetical protein
MDYELGLFWHGYGVYGERRLTARDTDSSRKRNRWFRQGPSTTL